MTETDELVEAAFNEWWRRYTEQPEQFEHEFRTHARFLEEIADGKVPSYGATCIEYLRSIIEEQKGATP